MIQLSKQLVLGSQSPRRKQLLADLGLSFEVQPIHANEDFPPDIPAREVAEYLARKKAVAYTGSLEGKLLITSDTTVVLGDLVLNKPVDVAEAQYMLNQLSGAEHQVVSGVCLRTEEETQSFSVTTHVRFRVLTPEEIDYYITQYKPFDKAGAYGIQEWIGQIGIEQVSGSYTNVVGLPTTELWQALQDYC
jgi:septum formation protein